MVHTFRAVVSTLHAEDTPIVLRVSLGGRVLAERAFTVRTKDIRDGNRIRDWKRIAFDFTLERDTMADVSVLVKGKRYIVVGAVSVMPGDNFRGMRADVVEHLREIGTSVVRWPGGNFAGEYRWRDGFIADPDERAPSRRGEDQRGFLRTHTSPGLPSVCTSRCCEKIMAYATTMAGMKLPVVGPYRFVAKMAAFPVRWRLGFVRRGDCGIIGAWLRRARE